MPVYYPCGHRIGQGYLYANTGAPPPPPPPQQQPGYESNELPQSGNQGFPPPPPGYQSQAPPTHGYQTFPPPIYHAAPIYYYDPYGLYMHGWQQYDTYPGGQPGDGESEEDEEAPQDDDGDFWPSHPPGITPPSIWRDLQQPRQSERQPVSYPPERPPQETPTRRSRGRRPRGQGLPPPGADPSGHIDWVRLRVFADEAMEDLRNGRPARGNNISVPQDRTVDRVIEMFGRGAGWRLVEVSQLGNGEWREGRSIAYGSPEAAMRIEELGWTRARNGTEAPPVWVVLARVQR